MVTKHCKQHPTKPNMLQCKDKKTGKKKDVPKPPGWDDNNQQNEMCGEDCRKLGKTAAMLGAGFVVYKVGKICVLTFIGGPVGFGIGVATP
ncbi:hypothetical protein DENIS_3840 [Desulfonema ishimotonii]|uniref:Uncharacterized protein n=1 Tax=Desulfonema ishimotonii TaxID=45657 RepID=A0A401G0Y2_9BACT|nr:hypothetical protein [Desulfonema ishimotonii]GBC62856.1 hypothetical protein DENIS_3840 [Desulfonema ishimotonii]